MVIRKIAQIGTPVLRERAAPVREDMLGSPEIQALIDDLIETMRDAHGAGLAAPQVYESLRICVVEVGDNPRYPYKPKIPLTVLVNPEIDALTDEGFDNFEGCLSVTGLRGVVRRVGHIRVRALDRTGAPLDFEARGFRAGTFQHEVDHLDGRLFVDAVADPRTLCTWDAYERYHRADFLKRAEVIVAQWGE